jgi:hypothetical protein
MGIRETGCCGAYCGTCPVLREQACKGCKLGYDDGTRDIAKARCKIKVCCVGRGLDSCADCAEYDSCGVIQGFYAKNGYKYAKYRQAIEFIRAHGYAEFLEIANRWTRQYGRYR